MPPCGTQNYDSFMAIMGALADQSVYRLKKTWHLLQNEHGAHFRAYQDLMRVTERGGRDLKALMDEAMLSKQRPNVPFIGLLLNRLVVLSEMDKYLPGDIKLHNPKTGKTKLLRDFGHLIDFDRLRKRREFIDQIEAAQELVYTIRADVGTLEMIMTMPTYNDLDSHYKRSLDMEPRENDPTKGGSKQRGKGKGKGKGKRR